MRISKSISCEQWVKGLQFPFSLLSRSPPAPSKSALGTSVTVPLTATLHWGALTRGAAANALTSCGAASAGEGDPLKAEVVKLFRRGLSLLRVINSLTATLRRNEWTHTLRSNNYANGEKLCRQRIQVLTWIGLDSLYVNQQCYTHAWKSTELRWNLPHRPIFTMDISLYSHILYISLVGATNTSSTQLITIFASVCHLSGTCQELWMLAHARSVPATAWASQRDHGATTPSKYNKQSWDWSNMSEDIALAAAGLTAAPRATELVSHVLFIQGRRDPIYLGSVRLIRICRHSQYWSLNSAITFQGLAHL